MGTLDLPEGCISHIISFTSPRDACRWSSVSPLFKSASDSDVVWEKFLPSGYKDLISQWDTIPEAIKSGPKKDLYFYLCNNPIRIGNGNMIFSIDRESGKKRVLVGARGLSIAWGDTPEYWQWISGPELAELAGPEFAGPEFEFAGPEFEFAGPEFEFAGPEFAGPELAGPEFELAGPEFEFAGPEFAGPELAGPGPEFAGPEFEFAGPELAGPEFEFAGPEFAGPELAGPESRFPEVAALIDVCWLHVIATVETRILSPQTTYEAYLVFNFAGNGHNFQNWPVQLRVDFEGNEDGEGLNVFLDSQGNDREDGWKEAKMGEFFNEDGEDGPVLCSLKEVDDFHWKYGLIVEGIELRPKHD